MFREFLSSHAEAHALAFGFFHGLKSFMGNEKLEHMPKKYRAQIREEYHYYMLGIFLAKVLQGVSALILIKLGMGLF